MMAPSIEDRSRKLGKDMDTVSRHGLTVKLTRETGGTALEKAEGS